jgi:hypothetical protein
MLALINDTNGFTGEDRLTFDQVTFQPPVAVDSDDPDINTKVVVESVEGVKYVGPVEIDAFRLDAGVLFGSQLVRLDVQGAVSTADLLPRLNEKYGLALDAQDIVDQPIDHEIVEENGSPHTITFAPDCFHFIGKFPVYVGPETAVNPILWEAGNVFRWQDGSIMVQETA